MKLWAFGASYTHAPNHYEKHEETWPSLLAKKINCEYENLADPGASNEMILDCYMKNSHRIKENDITVILLVNGASFYTSDGQQLKGIPIGGKEWTKVASVVKDIDSWINLKTIANISALNLLSKPKTYIFSDDSKTMFNIFDLYNVKKNDLPKFYFWPKIDLFNHISLKGKENHPDQAEQIIIADCMYEVIQSTL